MKRWKINRIIAKKIILLFILTIIACLPFVYITEIIGLEIFLDSFENSNNYICIKDRNNYLESNTKEDYLIIQKSSHPEFKIEECDIIIYHNYDGEISFTKVNHISSIAALRRYHIDEKSIEEENCVIYDNQILGKIIEIVDNNILNSISIKIWETSIHNLNLRSIIMN
jgi:hypothetical protein